MIPILLSLTLKKSEILRTTTIKEFAASRKFVQINPSVRENESRYPFITFITADNKAENVYFSKEAAKKVTSGTAVDKQMLSTHQIGFTVNALGEERIKLISNSTRITLSDLFD